MRGDRGLRATVLGFVVGAVLLVAGVCGSWALDVSAAPSGGSMATSEMAGMAGMAGAPTGVAGEVETAVCDGMCAMGSDQVCGALVALGAVSVLGLLLASRRHTLLGLVPRQVRATPGGWAAGSDRVAPAWGRLELCVIRV